MSKLVVGKTYTGKQLLRAWMREYTGNCVSWIRHGDAKLSAYFGGLAARCAFTLHPELREAQNDQQP